MTLATLACPVFVPIRNDIVEILGSLSSHGSLTRASPHLGKPPGAPPRQCPLEGEFLGVFRSGTAHKGTAGLAGLSVLSSAQDVLSIYFLLLPWE